MGRSRRAALFAALGISAGTMIWALSGFLGINLLFKTAPWVYFFLKLLGGCYLVYLGLRLLTSSTKKSTEEYPMQIERIDPWRSFKLGLLTNLSNVKTAAFMASVFAATLPSDASYLVGMASIALMVLISIGWYTLVAYIFSFEPIRDRYRKTRSWIERLAGVIFIGFGVKLATGEK